MCNMPEGPCWLKQVWHSACLSKLVGNLILIMPEHFDTRSECEGKIYSSSAD